MTTSDLKIIIIGAAINFIGAGLAIFGNKVLGIILISIGFIALSVISIQELKKRTAEIIFYDDFSEFKDWKPLLNGSVFHSDEKSHSGACSLKKITYNDPNGGYKLISKKVKPNFCFSGWIFRPSGYDGGPADRLALEDDNGNGYGFVVRHEMNDFFVFIEKREDGIGTSFMPGLQFRDYSRGLTDEWYYFEIQITSTGKIFLRLNHNNKAICQLNVQDLKYNTFSRVTIRGGNPYFVDDLKIIKC